MLFASSGHSSEALSIGLIGYGLLFSLSMRMTDRSETSFLDRNNLLFLPFGLYHSSPSVLSQLVSPRKTHASNQPTLAPAGVNASKQRNLAAHAMYAAAAELAREKVPKRRPIHGLARVVSEKTLARKLSDGLSISNSLIYRRRPFVLLTGSVVVLVLLVIGSVSLLSGVGYNELPSTLLSATVSSKRD